MLGLAGALLAASTAAAPDAAWRAELERWRAEKEASLRERGGWLSLAGLYWLEPGETTFGSAPDNRIVLRPPTPPRAGRFRLEDGRVSVRLEPGVDAEVNAGPDGADGDWRVLRSDADPEPDEVVLGALRLRVILRGTRFAIRALDDEHPRRTSFPGLHWYPPDEAWRVSARFTPHPDERTIPIADVTGQTIERENPGYATFEVQGRSIRLEALYDGDSLFFIFSDATSGRDTYGGGRYLHADPARDGALELDFNRAYSPPCAFTAFATCPLPPRGNRLDLAVEAGERSPEPLH